MPTSPHFIHSLLSVGVARTFVFSILIALATLARGELRAGGMDAAQTFRTPEVVALVLAIEAEDLNAIDAAIQNGANINSVGESDQTPLHWSLLKRGISIATVKHLLERGADPNAKMSGGKSPLFLTAGSNRPELLELFLAHGGDPNTENRLHYTPLTEAIASQYEVNVRLLLKHGANPNLGEACLSTVGNARFDFTVQLLQSGLTKELSWCARLINRRVIAENSPMQAWRIKVFELLAERGVTPPFESSDSK
jgi:hypothetical protein